MYRRNSTFEARRFIKRLAVLKLLRLRKTNSQAMCIIRTRLSTDIMRSVLVYRAVRGVQGKAKKAWIVPISSVSFNLMRRAFKVR